MNMISTGSFLTETGASNKQSELVKKLTAAWEKKNSKTARAGGASLMALSLAACGGEDNTPFSQADVDAAVAAVDITTDNAEAMTSNDADIAAAAKTEALTAADGTIYATVDAAVTAGSNTSNADAVTAALTSADGTVHASVDAAITSNDASVEAAATTAAEATLVAGSGFDSVAALLAAYQSATGAPTPMTSALTTSSDVVSGFTSGADAVTGTAATYNTGDVIVDSDAADGDTLTVTSSASITATPVVMGIENVNVNYTMFTEPSTALTNIKDGTVTISNSQVGGSTNATATAAGNITLVAGSGVSGTLTVTQTDGTNLTIDAGSAATVTHSEVADTLASTVTVNGSAASTSITVDGGDQGAVTVNGTATDRQIDATGKTIVINSAYVGTSTSATTDSEITITGENNDDDSATITAAGVVTLAGSTATETITLSGSQAVTATVTTGLGSTFDLAGENDIAVVSTKAVASGEKITSTGTGTYSVRITDDIAGAFDASKFDNDISVRLDDFDSTDTITIDSGATVDVRQATSVLELVSSAAANTTGESLNIVANAATVAVTNGTAGDGTGADRFETVNVSSSTVATTVTAIMGDAALTLDGGKAITLAGTSTASGVTNNGATVTYNLDGTSDVKVYGHATARDTINVEAGGEDLSNNTMSDIDVITLLVDAAGDNATDDQSLVLGATQVNGKAISIIGDVEDTGSTKDDITITANSVTVDLGGLVVDSATISDVTINLTSVAALATNITGSNIVDNLSNTGAGAITIDGKGGADVISTGSGADTITGGEGGDTITGGAGADTVHLAEATAATDTVVLTTGGAIALTTITGFATGSTNGDNLDIDLSDLNGIVTDMNTGDATALATATGATLAEVSEAYNLDGSNSDILVLVGDFADSAAVETALETGGSHALTFDGAADAGDAYLVLWDTGSATYLSYASTTAGVADDAKAASGDLTVTNIVAFTDISASTDFVSGNLDIIA